MHKRLVGIVATVAVIAAACGGATTSTAPSTAPASTAPGASAPPAASAPAAGGDLAPDQTYRIYVGATDPRSLNPQAMSGSDEISVSGAINRGLLALDKDLKVVPELAEAMPEITEGGKVLTFKLKDAKYSNGDTIVAADFVRSMRKLADPRNAYDYAYEMCYVTGVDAVMGGDFGCAGDTPYKDPAGCAAAAPADRAKACTFDDAVIDDLLSKIGVEAPDAKTVIVRLATPVNFFTNIMAMWLTTPTNEKSVKYAEAADLISSGPFMMESWTHNAEMVLVPNPNWAGAKPTLTKIVMTFGGDPEAAVASYERGDLDTVQVPGSSARRVLEDPTLKDQVKDLPQLTIAYYDFATCQNPKKCPPSTTTANGKTPLQNKNFRIAMTRAIDKKELIDVAYGGTGKPATGSVMPGIPGWPDDYDPYSYDVKAANEAMKLALTELGVKDGPDEGTDVTVADVGKLKFGYNCDAGHTPRVVYLAGAWRKNLGFGEGQFDISCTDFAVFRTERREGNKYDITRNAWGADFPNPDNQLRDLFLTGVGLNNSGYQNPAFDDTIKQASLEQDPTKAHDLYVKAQRMLVDDAPVIWLSWNVQRYLVKPYLAGLVPTASDHNNIGDIFYETIQIKKH